MLVWHSRPRLWIFVGHQEYLAPQDCHPERRTGVPNEPLLLVGVEVGSARTHQRGKPVLPEALSAEALSEAEGEGSGVSFHRRSPRMTQIKRGTPVET